MAASPTAKPRIAVFKFASCDGCQLSLLSLEEELLTLAGKIEIAYFLEATSRVEPGPYDVALVEGSITTEADAIRIRQVRQDAKFLMTLGACATTGGIQALRKNTSAPSMPDRTTSVVSPHRPRSPITSLSTSSSAGARSTAFNCSRFCNRCWRGVNRGRRPTASASNANVVARFA